MSQVRALIGTKKGAFVLTSDAKREKWDVAGPHFGGWEIYHIKGSPLNPDRLYASQTSSWFGQVVQRSDDGGKTWESVNNEFRYVGEPGTHLWYDGTPRPFAFKRIWQFERSLEDAGVVYAGAEAGALLRSPDGGRSWSELAGLRCRDSAGKWQPGAGGISPHTGLIDPARLDRLSLGISAACTFRCD